MNAAGPRNVLATEQSACSAASAAAAAAAPLRMRDKRVCPPDKDGGQMRNHGDVSEFSPYLRKRKRAQFCCRTYLALYDPKKAGKSQMRLFASRQCVSSVSCSSVSFWL